MVYTVYIIFFYDIFIIIDVLQIIHTQDDSYMERLVYRQSSSTVLVIDLYSVKLCREYNIYVNLLWEINAFTVSFDIFNDNFIMVNQNILLSFFFFNKIGKIEFVKKK